MHRTTTPSLNTPPRHLFVPRKRLRNGWSKNRIYCRQDCLKPELVEILKKLAPQPSFAIDEIVRSYGHEVIRTPPYHPELQPIETCWGVVKNHIARHSDFTMKNLIEQLDSGFAKVTAKTCNEIYRGNTPNVISVFAPGPAQATYSNIEGGTGETYFGTGCIYLDPLFFNSANPPGADSVYGTLDDGLHLTSTSPSVNTGLNAAVPAVLTKDIAGQNRIQYNTVDMGAYEYVGIPIPNIRANSQDGSITVSLGTPVSITVSLNPNNLSGQNADWWVAESAPDGLFYHFDLSTGSMVQGLLPTYQGALFSLGTTQVLNSPNLTVGHGKFVLLCIMSAALNFETFGDSQRRPVHFA